MNAHSRRAGRVPVALAAIVSVALVGLSACSDAERDADTDEIVGAGTESAFSLRVGDCFNDPSGDDVADVEALPCSEPHDNEVYHLFDLPDGDFPGEDAVMGLADEGCAAEFDGFVGAAYADSELDFYHLTPTNDTWNQMSDREVVCLIWDPAGPTTGSLKGAAR